MNNVMNPYINPQFNAMANMNRYQPPSNGIIWVQGIEGAKAYQLTPNSNALLMDSEIDGRFYIKVSDNVGMCSLRVFNYEEITDATPQSTPQVDLSDYVRKDELQTLIQSMLGGKEDESTVQSTKPKSNKKPLISE